jgi:AraC family transcriptional regulator
LFLCVDIAPLYWKGLAEAGARLQRHAFDDQPMASVALRLLRELCEKRNGWQVVAEALMNELVAQYLTDSHQLQRREPRWLRPVLERLHDDPAIQSLNAVAADLDLHPVHVSRMFKRHMGVTLSQYLREQRLRYVGRALLESSEPLAKLADDHGFADQSHLTREFTRATSWSPAKLRGQCERLREICPRCP